MLAAYNQVLEDNKQVWKAIMPDKTVKELNFYSPEVLQTQPIDYSLQIIWDLLNRGGKKIRPVMILMLADLYGLNREQVLPLCFMVETVHNATLIIDDIEDNSEMRRGQPCVHLKFGIDNSINAGALGFFLPMTTLL